MNGLYSFVHIVDAEWDKAFNAKEEQKYYMCYRDYGFRGVGKWIKKYKPSIAKLLMKRGAYDKMEMINY